MTDHPHQQPHKPIDRQTVASLLAFIHTHEPYRVRHTEPDQIEGTHAAWLHGLEGVDAAFAAHYLAKAYRAERRVPMTPGEVRTAWLRYQERRKATLPKPDRPDLFPQPVWFREAAAASRAAVEEYRATTEEVPGSKAYREGLEAVEERAAAAVRARYGDAGMDRLVKGDAADRAQRRERHCGNPRCGCSHTNCRAGFLDLDEKWSWYESQARRCSRCAAHLPESA